MFPNLKIFVIEDQELLFAMSYKSNRSWTLPDYTAISADIPDIPVGIAVTWNQPAVCCGDFCIGGTEYCHSTSGGWIPFSGQKSLIGVDQTYYRVHTCRLYPLNDSCTCLCAVVVGGSMITSTSGGDCDSNLYTTTLGPISCSVSYYFKGEIDEV